jgi:hypothetical protein
MLGRLSEPLVLKENIGHSFIAGGTVRSRSSKRLKSIEPSERGLLGKIKEIPHHDDDAAQKLNAKRLPSIRL